MLKGILAAIVGVLALTVAAAGIWDTYDECFSVEDYNVNCRIAYMAARESVRDFLLGPR